MKKVFLGIVCMILALQSGLAQTHEDWSKISEVVHALCHR